MPARCPWAAKDGSSQSEGEVKTFKDKLPVGSATMLDVGSAAGGRSLPQKPGESISLVSSVNPLSLLAWVRDLLVWALGCMWWWCWTWRAGSGSIGGGAAPFVGGSGPYIALPAAYGKVVARGFGTPGGSGGVRRVSHWG